MQHCARCSVCVCVCVCVCVGGWLLNPSLEARLENHRDLQFAVQRLYDQLVSIDFVKSSFCILCLKSSLCYQVYSYFSHR